MKKVTVLSVNYDEGLLTLGYIYGKKIYTGYTFVCNNKNIASIADDIKIIYKIQDVDYIIFDAFGIGVALYDNLTYGKNALGVVDNLIDKKTINIYKERTFEKEYIPCIIPCRFNRCQDMFEYVLELFEEKNKIWTPQRIEFIRNPNYKYNIIACNSKEKAQKVIEDIEKYCFEADEIERFISRGQFELKLKNGQQFIALEIYEYGFLGRRCNRMFYDVMINDKVLNEILMPCVHYNKVFPALVSMDDDFWKLSSEI